MKKRRARRQVHRKRRTQHLLLDDIFLQPWFLSKDIAFAVRHLIPDTFLNKMRFYFEDWGCLICGSKNRPYLSNGMCGKCVNRIQKRLFWCLEKRRLTPSASPSTDVMNGEERVRSAGTLLSDLARGAWSPNRMKLRQIKWGD